MGPNAAPRVAIARIIRARGNRGEVLAELHTDFPERFDRVEEVWLRFPVGAERRAALEEAWNHRDRIVLKFRGVDTIDAAELLAGAWVEIEAVDAVELPEGTYYDHDLVGCRLIGPSGENIGTVTGVLRIEGNHQLVVEKAGREFWVPARAEICFGVSVAEKLIRVDLPTGLIDLNKNE